MIDKATHIHRFRRLRGERRFICDHPDCNCIKTRAQLHRKRSLCNICGQPFILTFESLRRAKPRCDDCVKPRAPRSKVKRNVKRKISDILEKVEE